MQRGHPMSVALSCFTSSIAWVSACQQSRVLLVPNMLYAWWNKAARLSLHMPTITIFQTCSRTLSAVTPNVVAQQHTYIRTYKVAMLSIHHEDEPAGRHNHASACSVINVSRTHETMPDVQLHGQSCNIDMCDAGFSK